MMVTISKVFEILKKNAKLFSNFTYESGNPMGDLQSVK